MYKFDELKEKAANLASWLVKIRRDFHRYPELGMEEFRTRDKIVNYLEAMGIPYQADIANTGVVGLIEGKKAGKTVALRADMDALPIVERNDIEYKSTIAGKMHACGHDAHMTILLGAAKLLNERKDELRGNVKLIFQPAEETVGGAKPMIEAGVLENPQVDAIFGLHMAPELPVGTVGVKYDQMNAASDSINITINGSNAHGAYPHNGNDAIVIAAQVIMSLQTIVSRNIDPRQSAVITVGTIQGGTQDNIIADEVKLGGTIRTLDETVRARVLQRIEAILKYVTKSMGGTYRMQIGSDGYIALINNNHMVDIVANSATSILGEDRVERLSLPSMGVEDFAYFAKAIPAAFYRLGCRNEEKGIINGLHDGRFNIDEESLPIGVAIQTLNVINFLEY